MAIDLLSERGVPLERQTFTLRDLVTEPIGKLDDDAFTRVRIIVMSGLEQDQNRFLHALARAHGELRIPLAQVRRIDHLQQTTVSFLLGADHSPLETTIAFEQAAIELTAAIAQAEPDAYLAQAYRFGLLEEVDHLYRFSALLDRLDGRDANNILQGYTDVVPGRPTAVAHRTPVDDVRAPYDRAAAHPLSKLHALTLVGAESQARDYYLTIGPTLSDPLARMLYAEIASIEEQHVTHIESLTDPGETPLEQWLLREANEAYNYYSCAEAESEPRLKALWSRFCDYELGQLRFVMDLFRRVEGRDPSEVLPTTMPEPIAYRSHRQFVRDVLVSEVDFRAQGAAIGRMSDTPATIAWREQLSSRGSPSEMVAAGYRFTHGTELTHRPGRAH